MKYKKNIETCFHFYYSNEVWRYDATQFGTHATRLRTFMLRGFVLGLGLTAVTVACETFLGGNDHHGHGHDGDDHH